MLVERVLPVARGRLVTVRDDALLTEVAKRLGDRHTNLVVVCGEDGAMVGVASKTDVVRQIEGCLGGACTKPAASVMTRDVAFCRPDDLLQDAWAVMKDRGFLHLPIVDMDARPLGVLNARDALHALLGEVEHEESLLRDYVMGIGYR